MKINNNSGKKTWMTVGLVAAALTLGACGKKDEAPMETETAVDAQTAVEDGATGVATANDDVAVASANDGSTDDVAVASANDEVTVGADDKEMLDGTEDSEHVSTY
ncbi:hypothetical protein [Psychrobacter sp. JB385]|uniref:hypothetical protein n=1 Tax=Psychrobacter sp. JB385 TaxID=1434841 RepID=UPI00097F5CCC|nr:hypothetical protein [Psychrobacter sp. JB385]SJN44474.1 hypothetical protein CZ794_13725 [Psychrobacter sp. JB385]